MLAAQPTCPFPGLRPMTPAESEVFVGRDKETETLVSLVQQHRFMVVLGAAFSGKTSLLQAGLIPELQSQGWRVIGPIRPGRDPWRALQQTLNALQPITETDLIREGLIPWVDQWPHSQPLVMVIDPFDELFTLGTTLSDPGEVIECLTEVAQLPDSPLRVLISLRTEVLDECLRYGAFRQEMLTGIFALGPISEPQLEAVIRSPWQEMEGEIDPEWIQAILGQFQDRPYSLPWLRAHLLTQWGSRDPLTGKLQCDLSHFSQIWADSIDQWAEEIYYTLTEQEQTWLETLCLRLVRTDPHHRDVRNPQPQRRLLALVEKKQRSDLISLLEHLDQVGLLHLQSGSMMGRVDASEAADSELGTSHPEVIVDLCHGALIEGWHRLWAWREEGRKQRQWVDRVEDAWWAWECRGRPADRRLKELWLEQLKPHWPEIEPLVGDEIRRFYSHSQLIIDAVPPEPAPIAPEQQVTEVMETLETSPLPGLARAIQLVGDHLESSSRPLSAPLQSCLYAALDRAREIHCMTGHQECILAVACSPDGEVIASGGDDRMIRLWTFQGTLLVPPFPAHHGAILTLAFSPDSQVVASSSTDRVIRLWNRQGAFLTQFQGHEGFVWQLAFSPQGDCLASGSADGTIRLWNQQGQAMVPWQAHESRVRCVVFSPDGQWLVSGGEDQQIRFWDRQGQPLSTSIPRHDGRVLTVAVSPDGEWLASGGDDGTLRIWDRHGSALCDPIPAHEGYVRTVAIHPEGSLILTGGSDQLIKVWDLQGQPLGTPWRGHQGEGSVNGLVFHPQGEQVVSCSDDQTLRIWDLRGVSIRTLEGHTARVRAVACSQDGQQIVSGSHDRSLRLWDRRGNLIGEPWEGHQRPVVSVAFHPKGQLVASGSHDRTIRLWDLQGQAVVDPIEGHKGSVWSVAFSPDGQLLASGSHDRTVRLWDLQGQPVGQPFIGHEGSINTIAFSPDGQLLASGSADGSVRLWDLQGNPVGSPLEGHEGYVFTVAFSPDSQWLLSGGDDHTLRLWDRQGHSIGSPWQGHEGRVGAVAFSPDGQTIASCSDDHTIRLWDHQGQSVGEPLQGHHQGTISAITFSPEGRTLISGGDDGTVHLWRGNWHAWLGLSCERIRHHPLFQAPTDETLQAACRTCYHHVWSLESDVIAPPTP